MQSTTKKLAVWAAVVAAILMIPLLTNAPWTGGDFIFAGTVLFGAGLIYVLTTKNMGDKTHRIATGIAVALAVGLIWAWAVA